MNEILSSNEDASPVDHFSGYATDKAPFKVHKNDVDKRMRIRLPETFSPGNFDVICAKGSQAHNHAGNRLFRRKVQEFAEEYGKADSKVAKSMVVSSVVESVQNLSPDGGFVKHINGAWYEIGVHLAREKVGQALREKNHRKYKSTSKAKRQRWKREQEEIIGNDEQILVDAIRSTKSIIERIDLLLEDQPVLSVSDEFLLECFTQKNNFFLNTIQVDPQLQHSVHIQNGASFGGFSNP